MTPEERRIYDREWYKKNKERRYELNRKWQIKQQENFKKFKATLKCAHCHENDPVCLEFHHLNPKEKEIAIATAYHRWSLEKLEKEIAKCIILCANCHRKEHARLKL